MGLGWERALLITAIVSLLPLAFFVLAYGPFGLFGVPLVAIAALALYVRARRRRLHPEREEPARARPRPAPMPAVPDAELADLPQPVSACPDCGYLGIRMPAIGDGLWPGGGELGDRMVCPRCQWQGLPVRFDRREDYGAFLRDLSEGRGEGDAHGTSA